MSSNAAGSRRCSATGFRCWGTGSSARRSSGLGVSDTGREVRLGWRLGLARGGERVSFDLGLEAARRESANDDRAPEGRIGLRLNMRW